MFDIRQTVFPYDICFAFFIFNYDFSNIASNAWTFMLVIFVQLF